MKLKINLLILIFLFNTSLIAEAAKLTAVSSAVIGTEVEVSWTGPGDNYDSIFIIEAEQIDSATGINKVSILNRKNPVALIMPEFPGVYELRYWSVKQKKVLGKVKIDVQDQEAFIEAPKEILMGEKLAVNWKGPGNQYDKIALVDTKSNTILTTAGILSKRNPVYIHIPDKIGNFELQYLTRMKNRVLGTKKITVKSINAILKAPASASIGSTIDVFWEGPGNNYDQIALYPKNADKNSKAIVSQGIISKRNPIKLHLPETPGKFELRYQTLKSSTVLGVLPITINTVKTALTAPEKALAKTVINVNWQGPGNNYDLIAVVKKDAPLNAKPLASQSILNRRNPISLKLPNVNGAYELRYLTRQALTVLAKNAIQIEPAGRLAVSFERTREIKDVNKKQNSTNAIELILDASGSMLQRINGKRRIDIARDVLSELVKEHLVEQQPFALRVFGHKEANKCRSDLEIALSKLNKQKAVKNIKSIQAMNLAKTPIADSLAKIPSDLSGVSGTKTIVLITDGEETCDGNPAQVIANLRSSGLNLQISIVGFAIKDQNLKAQFQNWAELGGGSYFDAQSPEELMKSLRTVISGPFKVLDSNRKVVAEGIIGGANVILPSGVYNVETTATKPLVIQDVVIKAGELTEVGF